MKEKINSIVFTPEEVESGAVKKLLDYFLDFNSSNQFDDYYELHITTDGYCTIVEFDKVPYDNTFGGKFEYVDYSEGELIMKSYSFPDNHCEYFETEEAFEEALTEWLEENPGWKLNEFGRWYNTHEALKDKIREDLKKEEEHKNKLIDDLKGRHDNE